MHTSDYLRYLKRNNCCTAAYMFTYCCLLLPVVCVALFYGQFIYIFGQSFCLSIRATNANPQPALFKATNIWRNSTLPSVRCESIAFYKVVW